MEKKNWTLNKIIASKKIDVKKNWVIIKWKKNKVFSMILLYII